MDLLEGRSINSIILAQLTLLESPVVAESSLAIQSQTGKQVLTFQSTSQFGFDDDSIVLLLSSSFAGVAFLGIQNIHKARGVLIDDPTQSLLASFEPHQLTLVLHSTSSLLSSTFLFIHYSDGWDQTPQLCSLISFLNPRHRTLTALTGLLHKLYYFAII
ncbi:hypothetical protein BLNAU_21395 [Blattamonas nauphoetae]|uniref:Myotubularin phosphatase domain-containing protein n=1 Tax=Blattamonas nauphoetae TaxID=2049346 RepID=A0ABQ9WYB4_9EUKA|nr:hypothetical protein BLNAU_21395 [Blattamonas nauphoetae]